MTKAQGPPEAPAWLSVAAVDDGKIRVEWREPDRNGGSAILGYKLHWTANLNSWNSFEEAVIAHVDQGVYTFYGSYSITGLTNGTEYRVRIFAYNLLGNGEPSNEVTAIPVSLDDLLRTYMEEEIIAVHGDAAPWLRAVWEHMKRNGKVFRIVESSPGKAAVYATCTTDASDLQACRVTATEIKDSTFRYSYDQLPTILIHEMAHYFEKSSDLSGDYPALAGFRLHLESLPILSVSTCNVSELFADVFLLSVLPTVNPTYWDYCTGDYDSTLIPEALSALRSALSGTMPAWFSSTYGAMTSGPDLERLWADVKSTESVIDRYLTVYQLRNAFGGYCSNARATEAAFGNGVARNPWRDGGCVPDAPGNVAAVAAGSGKLAVSWDVPASDGGSPIEGYRVQWKSGSQQYDSTRQALVVGAAKTYAHTIAGLTNGTEHSIRIVPYNQNGDGSATEINATPFAADATPPEFLEATVDGDALVLTWNEALDTGSVPAVATFSVTVGGSARPVRSVAIAGSSAQLTLSSPVVAGEVVSVSYTVPTAPGAALIRDLSQNAAPSLTGTSVQNTTVQPSSDVSIKRVLFVLAPNSSVVNAYRQRSGDYDTQFPAPWATNFVRLFVEPSDSNAIVTFSPPLPPAEVVTPIVSYCGRPGDDCRGYHFTPPVGENVITVSVTAEDGVTRNSFTVTLVREVRPVSVEFAKPAYVVTEGSTTSVTVRLDADPERTVTIPITATRLGGVSRQDYSASRNVTFSSGGPLAQSVTVTASTDSRAEQGERIVLRFGSLPDGVERGSETTTTVTLQDEDFKAAGARTRKRLRIDGCLDLRRSVGLRLSTAHGRIRGQSGRHNALRHCRIHIGRDGGLAFERSCCGERTGRRLVHGAYSGRRSKTSRSGEQRCRGVREPAGSEPCNR